MRPTIASEIFQLADCVGQFIEYWGFKKIHGKIWTLLYLSQDPLSATELCKRLGVSKTLLSFSVAELLKYKVIEEDSRGPKRTVYYRANADVTSVILNVLRGRERVMLFEIEAAQSLVKRAPRGDFRIQASRMAEMQAMTVGARGALEALTEGNDLISCFAAVSSIGVEP